jgi:hypothetical protein
MLSTRFVGKNQWVEVTEHIYGVKPFFFFKPKAIWHLQSQKKV